MKLPLRKEPARLRHPAMLLTGFEAFGGDGFNPSGAIARALHGTRLAGGGWICGRTLPVSGPAAWAKMSREIRRIRPHWIVALGVSGRGEISIESTAWNEDNYRIPDNAGLQPQGAGILRRGPGNLDSALAPLVLPGMLTAGLREQDLPIRASTDPGRYVCNHVYYRLLHLTRRPGHSAGGRSLFLHLPPTPEMRRGPEDARIFYPLADLKATVAGLLDQLAEAGAGNRLA